MASLKIFISGAGIAGLTAALCLAKQGHRVEVFERMPVLQEHGAGIQISPNAFHVLNSLGLGKHLREQSEMPNAIFMMNAKTGQAITTLPLGLEFEDKYSAPYLVLHRADLQKILLDACEENAKINIHYGQEVVDATSHMNGVTALVKSNEIHEKIADILIGADGVHSQIRKHALGLPQAVHSGRTAWRTVISNPKLDDNRALNNTMVWLGSKAHAVTYPMRNKSALNVIAVTQEKETQKTQGIKSEELYRKFSHWDESFSNIFSEKTIWTGWPLFETPMPKKMASGHIALIGDAAHAMLPFAAQGAAQAIEDAYVLASSLSNEQTIEAALLHFEKVRLPRVREITKTASRNGRIYHLSGIMAASRNLVLSKLSGEKLLQQQDWIYRWKP